MYWHHTWRIILILCLGVAGIACRPFSWQQQEESNYVQLFLVDAYPTDPNLHLGYSQYVIDYEVLSEIPLLQEQQDSILQLVTRSEMYVEDHYKKCRFQASYGVVITSPSGPRLEIVLSLSPCSKAIVRSEKGGDSHVDLSIENPIETLLEDMAIPLGKG